MAGPIRHAPSPKANVQQRRVASPAVAPSSPMHSSAGTALPDSLRSSMETSFGSDFSNVRVHQGQQASALGALAYTQGNDIHFAPGQYSPSTLTGRSLLGHELTHVMQQRAGRVHSPQRKTAGAVAINSDHALESEAERLGARAARGEPVTVPGTPSRAAPSSPRSIQAATRGVIQRAAVLVGKKEKVDGNTTKKIDLSHEDRRDTLIRAAQTIGSGTPMKFFITSADKEISKRTVIDTENGPEHDKKIKPGDHIDIFGHSAEGYPGGVMPTPLIAKIKSEFQWDLGPDGKWKGDMRIFSCHAAEEGDVGEYKSTTIYEMGDAMSKDSQLGGVSAVGGTVVQGGLHPNFGLVTGLTGPNSQLRSLFRVEKRPEAYRELIASKSLDEFSSSATTISVGKNAKKKNINVVPKTYANNLNFKSLAFTAEEKEEAKTANLQQLQALVSTAFNRNMKAQWFVSSKAAGWKPEMKPLVGNEPGQVKKMQAIPITISAGNP